MRRPLLPACLLFVGLLAAGACASAPKTQPGVLELAKADRLVSEGCYDCLSEAREIYATFAVGKARPSILPRLFETTVLLGLREKELALDPSKRFEVARALVPELPPTYSAKTYLDMAIAVLPDRIGTAQRRMAGIKRPSAADYGTWQASLQTGTDSILFRRYLSISLDCAFGASLGVPPRSPAQSATATGARPATPAPATSPVSAFAAMPPASTDPPGNLLAYRRANCARVDKVLLTGLAEGDERFLEAGVLAGRIRSQMPTSKEMADARKWLKAASAKWPASPAVSFAYGAVFQTSGDCRTALTHFDHTLALEPQHEAAQLNRLICLSYTKQHPDAIAQGTKMITEGVEEGEARYWRAWNLRETGKLADARIDSDRAKQLIYNDRILTLAGQIEHDQDDLDIAEKDLSTAAKLNENNCIAPWYFALVKYKRQAWPATAEAFIGAMTCYRGAVAYDRSKLDAMKTLEGIDEEFRASQIAAFEIAIKDDEGQVSASALNAAINYARANNREKALEYCDLAAKDPDRAKQAAELRAMIVK